MKNEHIARGQGVCGVGIAHSRLAASLCSSEARMPLVNTIGIGAVNGLVSDQC